MECLQDHLSALSIWDHLNETQRQVLLRGTVEQVLPHGGVLKEESGMLLLLKGSVRASFSES